MGDLALSRAALFLIPRRAIGLGGLSSMARRLLPLWPRFNNDEHQKWDEGECCAPDDVPCGLLRLVILTNDTLASNVGRTRGDESAGPGGRHAGTGSRVARNRPAGSLPHPCPGSGRAYHHPARRSSVFTAWTEPSRRVHDGRVFRHGALLRRRNSWRRCSRRWDLSL